MTVEGKLSSVSAVLLFVNFNLGISIWSLRTAAFKRTGVLLGAALCSITVLVCYANAYILVHCKKKQLEQRMGTESESEIRIRH